MFRYAWCMFVRLEYQRRFLLNLTWDWDYLQGHCCGPTKNAIKLLSKKNQGKCKMHQVCIRNLLCGDVEGALTTGAQWHVSTLKACLPKQMVHHIYFHRSKSISTWMELGREDAGHWLLLLTKVEGVSPPPPPPWPSLRCLLGHTWVESE